ncbi:MAG: ImmA/IrrE family metallo-endopeptidase [Dehalococcoidia bacterium]|nr:ImmA/IrrE family metallo-endopeptidase [Dehalococcoidia bacterium]
MGWLVAKKVTELLDRYPDYPSPIDIELLAADQGCNIIEWPFLGPVKEVKQGKWIGLAPRLAPEERRYLIAHALGHDLLHCGNQLSFRGWQDLSYRKQEREADEFAARVLIPDDESLKVIHLSLWEIAEHFGVPEDLAIRRFTEFATEDDRCRWEWAYDDRCRC